MKFAKTFCKPSACVSAIPVGLPVTLRYSEHGLLQNYGIGFNPQLDENYSEMDVSTLDPKVFAAIKKLVPQSISVKGGTTWIYGVFYSDEIPCDEGLIPRALYQSYLDDLVNKKHFEFYAGFVKSYAAEFRGPLIIKNFLIAEKFNVLPQVIVPAVMTQDTMNSMTNKSSFPFHHDFYTGFFVFEEMNCRFASAMLHQFKVANKIEPFVDQDGFLKGEIETSKGLKYKISYSSILYRSITKGSIVLNETNEDGSISILACRANETTEIAPSSSPKSVKCPVCKKMYTVGTSDDPVQCDDPHCLSHLYQDACNMLDRLQLVPMTYEEYKSAVSNKDIICLTDILDLPKYKDVEITTSIANAIYSITPVSAVPDFDIIDKFVNRCDHDIETVKYYLNNPLYIETVLDIVTPLAAKFMKWLGDPYNVSSVLTIFSHVNLTSSDHMFEGDPIFRGNVIAITGRFKRGDHPRVSSIIRSYAATVVTSIEPREKLPDVVITGALNDGISGQMIQKARVHNIPIIDEDDFFSQYEIDQDLQNNLL